MSMFSPSSHTVLILLGVVLPSITASHYQGFRFSVLCGKNAEKPRFSPLKWETAGREQATGRGRWEGVAERLEGTAHLQSHGFPLPPLAGAGATDGARSADLSCAWILILLPWWVGWGRKCQAPQGGQAGPSCHSTKTPSHMVYLAPCSSWV